MNAQQLLQAHVAYRELARRIAAMGEVIGLPHFSAGVVQVLGCLTENEPKNVAAIGHELKITQQAVGKLLREAETVGLVIVKQNPKDRRARCVVRTMTGSQIWSQFETLVEGEG